MTDPVVTPAATEPVTPAATPDATAPVVVAAPAVPVVTAPATSLIPPAEGVTPEVTPPVPVPPTAANQAEPEWFLSDGVKGTGKAPDWYKADKYKTVDAQAKAYGELEKRFGSFTGAPKDGKYDFKMPEGLTGELDYEHPIMQNFQKWASEHQLNQDGYNSLLGMFAEYEASLVPDMNDIKLAVGENADARITAAAAWAKTNFSSAEYEIFREATSGVNAAAVFKAIEAVIGKTRQVRLPKPGEDTVGGVSGGEAAINAAQAKRGPDGKRLYDIDPKYRAEVESMRFAYYNNAQKVA